MSERDWDQLDERLEQAIDALNAERAPILFDEDDPELTELVDAARIVRRLRVPAEPDDDFSDRLLAAVSARMAETSGARPAPNGRIDSVDIPRRRHRLLLAQLAALLRVVGVCVLAGMIAGGLVGGLGGPAAMRLSGYLYEREHPGQVAITESSGEPVGQISIDGTLSLLIEMTLFHGLPGGLLYLLVAPWLPRGHRARGLVFAGLLLSIGGAVVITSDNRDFQRLGSPMLNVVMFGALIAGYGLAVVALAGWLDRISRLDAGSDAHRFGLAAARRTAIGAGIVGLLVMMMLCILIVVSAVLTVVTREVPPITVILFSLALFVVLPLARLAVALPDRGIATRIGGPEHVRRLALLALAMATAATLAELIASVYDILTGV